MIEFALIKDAFSSGQIGSKIWLCEELERLYQRVDNVLIFGGWYAVTAFLLRSRDNLTISNIVSLDIDASCEPIADLINENWVWQNWQFKAFTHDCCKKYKDINKFDIIINTSTEHFPNLKWFNHIPKGKIVVLQGADMKHDDHIFEFYDLDHFKSYFPLKHIFFSGIKTFTYPEWGFNRFMIIGEK